MAALAGPSRPRLPSNHKRDRLSILAIQDGMVILVPSEDAEEIEEEAAQDVLAKRMKAKGKGKGKARMRTASMTDSELAHRLAREEHEAAARIAADRAVALALANRIESDEDEEEETFAQRRRREQRHAVRYSYNIRDFRTWERRTHELVAFPRTARHVVNQAPSGSRPSSRERHRPESLDRRHRHREAVIHISDEQRLAQLSNIFADMSDGVFDMDNAPAASQSARPPRSKEKRLTGHDCVVCQDPIRGTEVRAPCGHYYDASCLSDMFAASARDESIFPPRCCDQNIPLKSVKRLMAAEALQTFVQKAWEYTTPNRVYCSNPRCSRFLGPQPKEYHSHFLRCPAESCGAMTCARCKAEATSGHKCEPGKAEQAILALAQRSGWARCPGCAQLIELTHGCNHMTCRCKMEFCYSCNAKWKTCTCPQWSEDRLVNRADIMGRQDVQPLPAVPPRPGNLRIGRNLGDGLNADVEEEMRRLLARLGRNEDADHDFVCAHWTWSFQWGGGRCEGCRQHTYLYQWRCRNCARIACSRCRNSVINTVAPRPRVASPRVGRRLMDRVLHG